MGHIDFQAAIEAAPDDDAPKLIYADWLEEQGIHGEITSACASPYKLLGLIMCNDLKSSKRTVTC